jgi:DNA-binding GntR family transcriptional regulator
MEKLGDKNKGVDLGGEIISFEEMVENGEAKIVTREMTDEELNQLRQSFSDWEECKRKQEQEAAERHKKEYIDSIVTIREGETIEDVLRRIAETLYNLEQSKAERPVYLR